MQAGMKSTCRMCGAAIYYVDPYWKHTGPNTPRHPAVPVETSTEITSTTQDEQEKKPLFSTLSIEAKPLNGSPLPGWHDLKFKIDGNDWSPLFLGMTLEFQPNDLIVANMRLIVSELNLENVPVEVRAQLEEWAAQKATENKSP